METVMLTIHCYIFSKFDHILILWDISYQWVNILLVKLKNVKMEVTLSDSAFNLIYGRPLAESQRIARWLFVAKGWCIVCFELQPITAERFIR